jgi:hypothetical protein
VSDFYQVVAKFVVMMDNFHHDRRKNNLPMSSLSKHRADKKGAFQQWKATIPLQELWT